MDNLNWRAAAGLLFLTAIMGVLIFFTAWTLSYWQGWAFLGTFTLSAAAITVYLALKDPKLLERRVKAGPSAEQEFSQRIIQSLSSLAFLSVIIVPVIDHRFAWSLVPAGASIAGDVLVVFGFYLVYLVFKENTFTSSTIEVASDQKVIDTGPYARVRHPMYAGALVALSGISPALGSWWGLLTMIPFTFVLIWRLTDEQRFLEQNLPGYIVYEQKVKYRIIPYIW